MTGTYPLLVDECNGSSSFLVVCASEWKVFGAWVTRLAVSRILVIQKILLQQAETWIHLVIQHHNFVWMHLCACHAIHGNVIHCYFEVFDACTTCFMFIRLCSTLLVSWISLAPSHLEHSVPHLEGEVWHVPWGKQSGKVRIESWRGKGDVGWGAILCEHNRYETKNQAWWCYYDFKDTSVICSPISDFYSMMIMSMDLVHLRYWPLYFINNDVSIVCCHCSAASWFQQSLLTSNTDLSYKLHSFEVQVWLTLFDNLRAQGCAETEPENSKTSCTLSIDVCYREIWTLRCWCFIHVCQFSHGKMCPS